VLAVEPPATGDQESLVKAETKGWTTIHQELSLSYSDIEVLLRENGIDPTAARGITLITRSPGSCGQQHRLLFPSDQVVFQIESFATVTG